MKFQHSLEVACPPRILWPLLTEPEQMKRWDPNLIDLVPEGEVPEGEERLREGRRFVLKVNEFGKESHFHGTVLAYEAGRLMDFQMEGGRFGDFFHITYQLLPQGEDRCRLEYLMRKQLRGKMRYFTPLIWLLNKIVLPIFLGKIRKLAEADAARAAA